MPWEDIGECGSGYLPDDAAWVDFCHNTAISYLKLALGEPPEGCELAMRLNDHDLGSYPTIGVYWAFPVIEAPWNYINRAEELLDRFNKAIEWGSLYPLPEDEDASEQSESNEEDSEMAMENPSPMTLTYYSYKGERFRCKHCEWQGMGDELELGEEFDQLVELDCPACQKKLTFVMYPTLAESRANWDRLSDSEKAQVELIEDARARFDALCLKTPEQLPEIAHRAFSITWDFSDDMTVLQLGDQEVFSEPAVYEGYERFEEVARILKLRYGSALQDLKPSPASETYLYGDSLTSSERIEQFRQAMFGATGKSIILAI